MSLRSTISGLALKTLRQWHGTVSATSFGVRRTIPLRGALATGLINRGGRSLTWKTAVFQRLPVAPGECFIDIGTSVGQTLLEFKAAQPDARYIGIDPNPAAIAYLNELIAVNALPACQTFCFAASDSAGPALLNIDPSDTAGTGATLIADLRPAHASMALGVATLPLDTISPFLGDARVALIKIDVEGAELFTLRGMTQLLAQHRPAILCEVLFPDKAADASVIAARDAALATLMIDSGYALFRIDKHSEAERNFAFVPIDHFPEGIYTPETASLCDYLFLPVERSLPTG